MARSTKQPQRKTTSRLAPAITLAVALAAGAAGGYAYAQATASQVLLSQDGAMIYRVNASGDVDFLQVWGVPMVGTVPGWTPVNIDHSTTYDVHAQLAQQLERIGQADARRSNP